MNILSIRFSAIRLTKILRSLAATMLVIASTLSAASDWTDFKQNFVTQDGRIVDAGQDSISHSEGQGFGMLLAVYNNDAEAFNRIWRWTRSNLQVRNDNLLAWRWAPGAGVTDKNDASDGDLLAAWALLRAYNKWHDPEYLKESRDIAHDIRTRLLRYTPHGLILLPGMNGFEKPGGTTINLSYWIFPALDEIGQAEPSPDWEDLANSGLNILSYAHFGRWGLPPDWLVLTQQVVPAEDISNHFGYNAIRIPLYLLWGQRGSDDLLNPYRNYWGFFKGKGFIAAWTNLKDDSISSYDASSGIHKLAQWVLDYPGQPVKLQPEKEPGYYSSVLSLLTDMAAAESSSAGRKTN